MADPASERRIVEFRMPDAASASDDKEMTPEELMKFIQDLEAGNVAMPQVVTHDRAGLDETADAAEPREVDFLRDTPARLLGYANEVGEGLRPVMPRLVAPSYAVAIAYVAADTVHKYDIARRGKGPLNSKGERASPAVAAADTLVWQLLASVAVPGFIINRAVWFAGKGVEASARLPPGLPLRSLLALPAVRKWLPTVAGIALIPFIVEPVDKFVHRQLDRTLRTWLHLPMHFMWPGHEHDNDA